MHVQLKIRLACPVDAAADALRDPAVMVAVTTPLVRYRSEEPSGFPDRWDEEAHPVSARILGLLPLGHTHVDLDWHERDGAWIQRDTGRGTSGQFARMRIDHRMAVSPTGDRGTLLRDRLVFHAGLLGPLLWPGLWLVWQWRGLRMRALAPSWRTPEAHPRHAG
ncbi:hypothetical protein EDF38_3062 [Frigoribacterium sp. PhB160]|uniref:hypothetical protein n=1 Tax=Frigoribacterium sp. PhB160 TaxID=2485192 RepID=UPI000F4937BE|nr:hypothetical protein [Frigoribacterium sp. PhB160]ROS58319.1 hypothetical protein EDF38_3062 [Frigoribacterium sp. PhB160]